MLIALINDIGYHLKLEKSSTESSPTQECAEIKSEESDTTEETDSTEESSTTTEETSAETGTDKVSGAVDRFNKKPLGNLVELSTLENTVDKEFDTAAE